MKRFLAISDIHGNYDKLERLLNDIKTIKAQYVFLGDYVDRGLKSKETIDFLIEHKNKHQDSIFIKGNHELMMLNTLFLDVKNMDLLYWWAMWVKHGGDKTLNSYGIENHTIKSIRANIDKIKPHFEFLISLNLYHQTENLFFVHAGVDLNKPFEMNTSHDFLWIVPPFKNENSKVTFNKKIVHGHTTNRDVYFSDIRIGVDTGSYHKDGKLSAALISENGELLDVFSVK